MKAMQKRWPFLLSALVPACLIAGPAQAQDAPKTKPADTPAAATPAPAVPATPKRDYLAELEPLVKKVILEFQPEAKVELRDRLLIAHYRNPQLTTHITNEIGNLSTNPATEFGPDFSEFLLYVFKGQDTTSGYPPTPNQETPETFGTTYTARHNLTVATLDSANSAEHPDVPRGHWAYGAIDRLAREKLTEALPCNSRCLAATRYEFAVAMARMLYKIQQAQKLKDQPAQPAPGPNADQEPQLSPRQIVEIAERPENKKLIEALKEEFTSELIRLGALPKDTPITKKRYEYLGQRFSYGKGVNPKLVEQVKQVVATYVEQALKASAEPPAKGQ